MNYQDKFPAGRPIQRLLPNLLKKIQHIKNDDILRIREVWPKIVGEKYLSMTKVDRLEKGTLYIQVSSPALLQLLTQHEKPRLLKELSSFNVKNILFRR